MATPLIRIPQEQGGTMYAFANASRDLTRSYYNPDLNFEFSKFALIKMPVVTTPALGSTNNYIQFKNLFDIGGAAYDDATVDNANVHFAQTFQNYALNLEQLVLTDSSFDSTILKSDSEKIFFKYLNRIGAFKARTANSQEVVSGLSRAVEQDNSSLTGSEYEKVIKYVGNIDVSNDKSYEGDTYNEVFVNVPSAVGFTPEILLKQETYNTATKTYTPSTYIQGRAGQSHPDANLNLVSVVDQADGEINIDANQVGFIENAVGIDFDSASYSRIVNSSNLNTLFDYSKLGGDFSFNAILVYYDIYSKSTPVNRATNLYGVLILDNFKNDPNLNGWYIPTQTKYKPNDITGLNGNAFALKLNVKFNSSLENVGVENNINDFSTFGMDIFLDTVSALGHATKLLADSNSKYTTIAQEVESLKSLILTSTNLTDIQTQLNTLQVEIENAKLNYSSSSSLLKLIQSTNARINQMIDGTIPTSVQYNIDVLRDSEGIALDKTVKDKIKIVNTVYGYELLDSFSYDISNNSYLNWSVGDKLDVTNPYNPLNSINNGMWARLRPYTNRVSIYVDQNQAASDINIYIDDSTVSWKNGQVLKVVFNSAIDLGIYNFKIYTNKLSSTGWKLAASFNSSQMISQKPYVELICIDEQNKTFELDILR
jgi:hypothetical protein